MAGLFGHHNVTNREEMLSDFQINSATYGEVVPVILGTTRISGNIIDYLDFTAHEHKKSQRVGKGGGSKVTDINYTYTVAVAIGLCEGPIKGLGKVWRNKDVLTYPSDDLGLTLFTGEYGQQPWSYTQSKHPEKALPYSGLAYVAGVVDLGARASLPQYNFEVKGLLLETGDGVDVNPADFILYVLTDERNGIGLSTDDIDMDSLERARQYWKATDLLISSPKEMKAQNVRDIINHICDLTGVSVYWSQNKLKFVPVCMDEVTGNGASYSPNKSVIYDLDKEDLIPLSGGALVIFERSDSSKAYNQATVEFTNRANGYETETVAFDIQNDILRRGVRPANKVKADFVYTQKRALFIAELLAKRYIYQRNTYTFKLDWAFCRLEPSDLVTLTDEHTGLRRKVVMVTQVKENVDGCLDITAVSVPDGVYSSAQINVHEADRPFIDRTVSPSPVSHMALFQPTGAITEKGLEVWCGVCADGPHFGGATVWVSDNGEAFRQAATIQQQSRIGELVDSIGADDTSLSVQLYHGELLSGTSLDAERGNTQLFIDGELVSYTSATLTAKGQYRLEGCIRGQNGTAKAAHGRRTMVVRLDDTLIKRAFTESDIGRKLYFKFSAFNEFGEQAQDLSSLEAVTYTVKAYYIPQVAGLSAYARYRQDGGAKTLYDVVVDVTPPSLTSYDKTGIFYKVDDDKQWQFAGFTGTSDGNTRMVIPQASLGEVYTIKAIVYDKHGYTSDDATARTETVHIEAKQQVPTVPEHFSIAFTDKCDLSWDDVTNADVDFYEVRTNESAGTQGGLVAKVNTNGAAVALTERRGTLYLFAHSRSGQYSAPATLTYSKDAPPVPSPVEVINLLRGFSVDVPPIPPNCKGLNVYIDGETYFTTSHQFTYHGEAGLKQVAAAYVDTFGEGAKSDIQMVTIKTTIDGKLIEQGSLTMSMMDSTITNAIEHGADSVKNEVASIVTALNGSDPKHSPYSAIAQLANGLELRVKGDELISRINMSPAGTTIDGRLLHVTGDTVFDKGVVARNIEAGSITADKLQVGTLSGVSANLGSVTAGRLTSNNGAVVIDADGTIKGVHIVGSQIDADVFKQAGYKIKNIQPIIVGVWSGTKPQLPEGVDLRLSIVSMVGSASYYAKNWQMVQYTRNGDGVNTLPKSIGFDYIPFVPYNRDILKRYGENSYHEYHGMVVNDMKWLINQYLSTLKDGLRVDRRYPISITPEASTSNHSANSNDTLYYSYIDNNGVYWSEWGMTLKEFRHETATFGVCYDVLKVWAVIT